MVSLVPITSIILSVLIFLITILLIYVFAIELNWLPSYGRGQTVSVWGWESGLLSLDGLKHLLLPSVSLTALMLPLFVRLIRSEMMEVLETEYVKFAWAKGLPRLRYKAEEKGIELRFVDRFYPSSKTCSSCGNVVENLPLSQRTYRCPVCGLEIDRDENAARNLKKAV